MLNKLKKIFFKDQVISTTDEFTNQYLVDRVVSAFKEILHRKSFDQQMMYDCDFLILLPPEIYNDIEVQAPLIAKGIIKRFYEVIKSHKDRYAFYLPLAESWHIQFVPKDFEQNRPDTDLETKIDIVSSTVSVKDWSSLTSEEINKVSINGKHSKYSKWNINESVLGRIDLVEKGRVRMKFNPNLELFESPKSIGQSSNATQSETTQIKEGLAKLFFYEDTKKSFLMKKPTLLVSKAKNGQEVSTLARLVIQTDDRGLKTDHFSLRYNEEARSFSIALYAPARINEKSLALSPKQGEEVWHPLTRESAIICGLTQIDFKALK